MTYCSVKSRLSTTLSFFALVFLVPTAHLSSVFAQEVSPPTASVEKKESSLYVEFLKLEERVYSQTRKTEIGDRTDLEAALRYQFDDDTFARLRIDTDPKENPENSKTSKFEILGNHRYGPVEIQIDFDLNTKDGKTDDGKDAGGISMGPDSDSKHSFIAYSPFEDRERLKFSFYPYNFGGEVGKTFNTWDVTRLYYIDGAPSTISETPIRDESIKTKTIPGIVVSGKFAKHLSMYLGFGAASYLHASNADFDLEQNIGATRWQWKQDTGYKLGYSWDGEKFKIAFQHVGHEQSKETGSLLDNASSMQINYQVSQLVLYGEVTRTKAGERPFRVSRETTWFETVTPFHPIYTDVYEKRHDWIGKSGVAWYAMAGWQIGGALPYVGYAHRSKYFIYREPESAHTLRTSDESASHGGLRSYVLGTKFNLGRIMINPQADWMVAKNEVFGNSSDVREDALLAEYNKRNLLITLKLSYNIDEFKN